MTDAAPPAPGSFCQVSPMVPKPGPAPRLPASLPPLSLITPYALAKALLAVLRPNAARPMFTSLTNPVWDGWATWRALAWRLPPSIATAPYSEPDDPRGVAAYWYAEDVLAEMAEQAILEKRLFHPFAHSTDQEAQGFQEWQFRIPGFGGYCYWEPASSFLIDAGGPWEGAWVTQENWREKLAPRDARMMTEAFGDGPLPPYALAQIERRWIGKMIRPVGRGRRGCPNLR